MAIRLLTDSGSDLPKEIRDTYHIHVMDLKVYVDDQEVTGIDPVELMREMKAGKMAKTAQIPLKELQDVFEEAAQAGDEVLYIAFSSVLSGTYQTALLAKRLVEEEMQATITVFDSKAASMGHGLIVLKAAQLISEGATTAEVLEALETYAPSIEHLFTVDTLTYLVRGGRVSRTKGMVADIMSIKPLLDVQEGALHPFDKVRGKKRLFSRMIEIMEERSGGLAGKRIGITYTDNPEDVDKIVSLLEAKGVGEIIQGHIGPAIGAHTGPGTLAIFYEQ